MLWISPEELFFLGNLMHAKYIDYDYIQRMGDIQKNFAMREKEVMDDMVKKGLLFEDFSGTMELDFCAENLLKPIFFGKFESELQFLDLSTSDVTHIHKFHFYEGNITHVHVNGTKLYLEDGIKELEVLQDLVIPPGYLGGREEVPFSDLDYDCIEERFFIRNTKISHSSCVYEFAKRNGIWYVGNPKGWAKALTRNEITTLWNELMRGE